VNKDIDFAPLPEDRESLMRVRRAFLEATEPR
jgi:hypothetical protein